ncbi:MAG: hypothetical protein M0001_08075 [Treponema sp.]|nr:hypothetical protein [Treponema sp.]
MKGHLAFIVLFVAASGLSASPSWWKSDEAGYPIERISRKPALSAGDSWWLEIEDEKGTLTKRLFRGAEEKKRTILLAAPTQGQRLEQTWHGKVMTDEIEFGITGQMLRESSYSEEKPAELLWSETYLYDKTRLAKVIRLDAGGNETGTRSYRYDPDGRLLSVELSGYYGNVDVGTLSRSSLPRAFWQEAQDGVMRIELFDLRGNVVSVRFVKADRIRAIQHFLYDARGQLLSDTLDDVAEGTKVVSTYGPDGKLATETSSKNGSTIDSRAYQWDKEGNLVVETRSYPLPVVKIDRTWDSNGKLLREERRENGDLVLLTSYEPDSVRLEETWSENQLVVRTRFENGIKVKEEFFKDGVVVRTRNYR